MKLAVFYHLAALNYLWKDFIDEQLGLIKKVGLADVAKIYVCYVAPDEYFDDVREYLNKEYSFATVLSSRRTIEENLYEGQTLKELQEYSKNNDAYVLYFHSKGVAHSINSYQTIPTRDWRHYMNYWMVERWKDCVEKLETVSVVGTNYNSEPYPHLSGNFWWANTDYIKTLPYLNKENINNTNQLQLVGHTLLKLIGYISSNLNNLKYDINPFIEKINNNISVNLNHYFTPEIINFKDGLSNLNHYFSPEISQLINRTSNIEHVLNSDKFNFNKNIKEVNHYYTPEIVSSDFNPTDIVQYQSNLYDNVTGSVISFKSYDSSSNLTFNSSSVRHYVRQINEVFYMTGSQITSSRINYQDDIELIVIGKGSTTTYKDNLDYNLPYRASYLVKNWPHYQYNTSSYWYLPIPLNASNDDILASGDIWVTASFQNGTDVFTDQYGFAIDL